RLEHGQPLRFGTRAVLRDPVTGALSVAGGVADDDPRVVVHDAHAEEPTYAFALSRLSGRELSSTPIGIFRDAERPTYADRVRGQVATAQAAEPADLATLIRGRDTWTIPE